MLITDAKQLKEIQREFRDKFPYLKLEFYNSGHEVGKGSSIEEQINVNKSLKEIRTLHTEGELAVHGNMKVSTLEQMFADMYGLNVQVFRKSGNIWLQTTKTDEWTLAEQNRKGQSSQRSFNEKHNV